jgi:hypothetical protein
VRDKRPATAFGVKEATTDPDKIRQWWCREPQYNVAVATGAPSGVFVLDIDGMPAEAELDKLQAQFGDLPSTVETITARGRHLFFKMPASPVRNSVGMLASGIDVRGDGGYVLVPPSVHPGGRAYEWSVDSANQLGSAPGWLLSKVCKGAGNFEKLRPSPTDWRKVVRQGVDEGQRDNTVTRFFGYLLSRRVDPFVALELVHLWNAAHCRPPLPTADIERIADSIAGRELEWRVGRGRR